MEKFITSYSCGKDSTLALYRMIKKGYIPEALLVTVNKEENKSWFHEVPINLIKEVSKSLNIPLILVETKGNDYEDKFTKALIYAKENLGVNLCVFGDIDLEDHRKWCTKRCKDANIKAEFPLWKEDREKLVYEFIDSGFKTVIKKVKLEYMKESFLGKVLNRELISKIKETGADACGENGEYHTFVYDGPIFNYPVQFKSFNIIKTKTHGFLEVKEV